MSAMLKNTLQEAMRKRTFVVITVLSVLYLVLWTILLYYNRSFSPHEEIRAFADILFTQMGLQFSSMLLSLLTIMLAAGCISADIENGMVHAILSRPISRTQYVLGKIAGLALLSVMYATLLYAALLILGGIFGLKTILSMNVGQILLGWLLYISIPLCLLCITVFGSTRIKTVPNGLLMIFIYILGNIGGMVEMIGNFLGNVSVVSAGIFISLLSPFHTLYNEAQRVLLPPSGIAGDLMRGMGGLSGGGRPASVWMFIFIGVYAVAFLALAVRRFRKIDI